MSETIRLTLDNITISRDALPEVEILEGLRMKLAQVMDAAIMRAAGMGRVPKPTTLYVDKYGRYSTVDPKEQEALNYRNRAPFGLIVSS
jgi:hypothetical protein